MTTLCSKCGSVSLLDREHLAERIESIRAEGNLKVIDLLLRDVVGQLREDICSICLHASQPVVKATRESPDWHKCRDCLHKNYAPATRCEKCGGRLLGIKYPEAA